MMASTILDVSRRLMAKSRKMPMQNSSEASPTESVSVAKSGSSPPRCMAPR